jgi:hypothetical protein
MTPEERQMLSGLFDRIRTASSGPRDPEADAFINDTMRNTPGAAYVLAQTVLVQQQALEAASRRISELEAKPAAQEGGFLGNIGRSLFGGSPAPTPPAPRGYEQPAPGYAPQRPAYAPPPPSYAPPPPQSGPWGAAPQSGGFLQGALQTATGVAGGVLLGNAIGGLFGGHGGGLFGGGVAGGGFGGGGETIVNNYYGDGGGDDVAQQGGQDAFGGAAGDDYAGGDDSMGGGGDDYA